MAITASGFGAVQRLTGKFVGGVVMVIGAGLTQRDKETLVGKVAIRKT